MKEKPILFSTEMVRSILEGRKTETRRVVKKPFADWITDANIKTEWAQGLETQCPYGQPGDVLWVREEHYRFGHWEKDNTKKRKTGRQAWKFVADNEEIKYSDNAPADFRKGRHHHDPHTPAWHKRLARFMPKAAARIWLQVEEIHVERLQDITEESAIAEGLKITNDPFMGVRYQNPNGGGLNPLAYYAFMSLWCDINGFDSWDANPWVWVVKFKVLSTTGKPNFLNQ